MQTVTRRLMAVVASLGVCLLAACNFNLENMEAPGLSKDRDNAAREVYSLFRAGDLGALRPRFGPEMQGPEADAAIPQIVALIPKEQPTKVRLISWRSNTQMGNPSIERLETRHEYTYADGIVDAETVMSREAGSSGTWTINGFHIKRRPLGSDAAAASAQDQPAARNEPAQEGEFITPEQAEAEKAAQP